MPKKSEFEHLKPQAFALLKKGATVSDVCDRFPEIPIGSVKTWARKVRELQGSNVKSDLISVLKPQPVEDELPPQSVPCEVVSDSPEFDSSKKISILPSGSESDFALVRKQMRSILKDPTAKPYAKTLAGSLLLKAVEMRATLPANVLDEVQERSLEQERRELRETKSAEDLAREYREMLRGTG